MSMKNVFIALYILQYAKKTPATLKSAKKKEICIALAATAKAVQTSFFFSVLLSYTCLKASVRQSAR